MCHLCGEDCESVGHFLWNCTVYSECRALLTLDPAHAILAARMIKSIMKDTIVLSIRFAAILKLRFSLIFLIRKLERF